MRISVAVQGRKGGEGGVLPEPRVPCQAGRSVRVHPVRLLLHQLPLILVEQRQVLGACGAVAGVQVRAARSVVFFSRTILCCWCDFLAVLPGLILLLV